MKLFDANGNKSKTSFISKFFLLQTKRYAVKPNLTLLLTISDV